MHWVIFTSTRYNYPYDYDDLFDRKAADVLDGRRSFPSGHSSTAFAGMTFVFLWITAQTAAWNLAYPLQKSKFVFLNCRSLRIVLSLVPLSYATWVAVSRVEDYVRTQVVGEIQF